MRWWRWLCRKDEEHRPSITYGAESADSHSASHGTQSSWCAGLVSEQETATYVVASEATVPFTLPLRTLRLTLSVCDINLPKSRKAASQPCNQHPAASTPDELHVAAVKRAYRVSATHDAQAEVTQVQG